MLNKKISIPFAVTVLTLAAIACNAVLLQNEPDIVPTLPLISTPAAGSLPQTQDDVPRVSVVDAKAALDSGEAIFVDVRSAESYAAGHIAGAISIPLEVIEIDPAGVALDKNRWIITYCT